MRRTRRDVTRSRDAPWRAPPSGSTACAVGRPCRRSRRPCRARDRPRPRRRRPRRSRRRSSRRRSRLQRGRPRSRAAPRRPPGTCRPRRASTVRPCAPQLVRELPDRRRLPGAVDADDEDHATGRSATARVGGSPRSVSISSARATPRSPIVAAGLEPAHELRRRRNADIGLDQRILEPLPRLLVSRVERRCGELLRQRAPALAEGVPQPREEPGLLRLVDLRRRLVAEQLRPRAAHPAGKRNLAGARPRNPHARISVAHDPEGVGCAAARAPAPAIAILMPTSCGLVPRQAPRDDLADAVAAHRDAVEHVGGLHRALLVRDHDELGAVGVATQQLHEAGDVRVVERGLDLVEEVEGARLREEEREQERDRTERLLAAGEQRQPRDPLARRPQLDLDPGLGIPPRRPRRAVAGPRRPGRGSRRPP